MVSTPKDGFTRVMHDVFAFHGEYAATDRQLLLAWRDGQEPDTLLGGPDVARLRLVNRSLGHAFSRPLAHNLKADVDAFAKLQSRKNRPTNSALRQGMLEVPGAWLEEYGGIKKQLAILQALQDPHPSAQHPIAESECKSALIWFRMVTFREDAQLAMQDIEGRRKIYLGENFISETESWLMLGVTTSGILASVSVGIFVWACEDLPPASASGKILFALCCGVIGVAVLKGLGVDDSVMKILNLRKIALGDSDGSRAWRHEDDAYVLHHLADHEDSSIQHCSDDKRIYESPNEKCWPWLNGAFCSSDE